MYDSCFTKFVINAEIHQLMTGSMGIEKQKINEETANTMKNLPYHGT
jgi:hypothetical protein